MSEGEGTARAGRPASSARTRDEGAGEARGARRREAVGAHDECAREAASPRRSATARGEGASEDDPTGKGAAASARPAGGDIGLRPQAGATPAGIPPSQGRRRRPCVGVVAVQGAFAEHVQRLRRLGCTTVELRQGADLACPIDALVLPGGESTVQSRLLRDAGMLDSLRVRILAGLPVLGTCAGLILLAERVEGAGDLHGLDPREAAGRAGVEGLRTLPVTVSRNAYGRQLGSFHAEGTWEPASNQGAAASARDACGRGPAPAPEAGPRILREGGEGRHPALTAAGRQSSPVPLTFIRAPRIERMGPGVQEIVALDGRPVAVQHGAQIAAAFHPELDGDDRLYERFLALVG